MPFSGSTFYYNDLASLSVLHTPILKQSVSSHSGAITVCIYSLHLAIQLVSGKGNRKTAFNISATFTETRATDAVHKTEV